MDAELIRFVIHFTLAGVVLVGFISIVATAIKIEKSLTSIAKSLHKIAEQQMHK
jgi:hypothetical protein